jgi:predicted PurR-regulated permease PerM
MLAIIAVIAIVAALKWSQSVTLPLAFALFIVALAWPLQNKLAEKMPHKIAFGLTLLGVVAVFLLFCGALYYCGSVVVAGAPKYADEARTMYANLQEWGFSRGLQIPNADQLPDALPSSGGGSTLKSGASRLLSVVGAFVLTFAFFGLGLLDARRIRQKLDTNDGDSSDKLLHSLHKMTKKFQRYFLVRTAISAIQGVCTFVFCLVVGLDFALVWGVSSALLNYIPTLGSLVAVIPPTLWALFQFQSLPMAALVFFGNCAIQLVLGSFVDPLLEGKQLQLSPLAVLVSIAFWGWVWGIGGALIGVPITVAIVIVCREFDRLHWLSELLAGE